MTQDSGPVFSEQELKYYKNMVGLIIDGDPDTKKKMDGIVRMCIAKAKQQMPNADKQTLVAFFASVAFVAGNILGAPVRSVGTIVESLFDQYTIAAAHEMGAYDIEGSDVPTRPEPAAGGRDPELEAELDKHVGQYL